MPFCEICKHCYDDGDDHVCPPIFYCCDAEYIEDDDWRPVYAVDANDAAERYVELMWHDWDYPDNMSIAVKDKGGAVRIFDVDTVYEASFRVKEKD